MPIDPDDVTAKDEFYQPRPGCRTVVRLMCAVAFILVVIALLLASF